MSRMIRFHKFGAADVLRCEEQAEPSPAADEVQVRVEAIGVSWYDVLWRQNPAPSQARLPAKDLMAAERAKPSPFPTGKSPRFRGGFSCEIVYTKRGALWLKVIPGRPWILSMPLPVLS